MYYVDKECTATLEVKQSKFIAHLLPYSRLQERLQELKEQHPKARHFVVAYRYLNEYEQVVEYSTDDGEPKGTSGKPALMVLQGRELINTAVIVVRYFGGTKLGTGGLVRAYSDAVNLVIENASLHVYEKLVTCKIVADYENTRMVDYELQQVGINQVEKQYESNVSYLIEATTKQIETLRAALQRSAHISTL